MTLFKINYRKAKATELLPKVGENYRFGTRSEDIFKVYEVLKSVVKFKHIRDNRKFTETLTTWRANLRCYHCKKVKDV